MTRATASQTTPGSRPELTQVKAVVFHEFGDFDGVPSGCTVRRSRPTPD